MILMLALAAVCALAFWLSYVALRYERALHRAQRYATDRADAYTERGRAYADMAAVLMHADEGPWPPPGEAS